MRLQIWLFFLNLQNFLLNNRLFVTVTAINKLDFLAGDVFFYEWPGKGPFFWP